MALLAAPVVGATLALGGGYVLTETFLFTANLTAQKVHGLSNAYPWPLTWEPQPSNSSHKGTFFTICEGGALFGLQRRFVWKPVRHIIFAGHVPHPQIKTFGQFLHEMAPQLFEVSSNAVATSAFMGALKPIFDGKNM